MKALVMEKYCEFNYTDVEKPVPGKNEVLIQVKACAVCGSDVHGMDGSTGRRQPPIIMGHEASGIIELCGEGVANHKVGDRVTFDSTIYCNECDACKSGNVNMCENRRVLGVSCDTYRMNGAFAEYIVVPEHVLYRLPENLTYEQASMVEPLAIAYHGATRCPAPAGGTALVVGVGTIGLLLVQVLKSMGVGTVIAVDLDDERLRIAKESGADCVLKSATVEQILQHTNNNAGVDAAYDATGISATANLCIQSTKLGGKIVLVGNLAKTIEFPLQWVVTREQSIFGSCASAGEYKQCLDLIASGKVNVDKMISRTVKLSDGHEWMNRIYNKEPGLYKIVLIP